MKSYIIASMFVLVLLFAGCLVGKAACPDTDDPVCGEDGKTYKNACFANKSDVEIEHEGPCVQQPVCEDSDGGKDIFTDGGVIVGGKTSSDSCKDSTTIVEYFCEDDEAASEELPCPAGYVCEDDKCAESPCVDSDDGVTPGTKGTVEVGSEKETDSCATNGSLKEYFCDGSEISFQYIECPTDQHCSNGKCVEYECEDSDGGKDKEEAGTTSFADDSSDDTCYDSDTVTEYYCQNNEIKSQEMDCDSGYVCVDGACVEQEDCTDSDGGKDKYEKGTTSYEDDEYQDSCYSDSFVLEYYCEDSTTIEMEKMSCGTGYECSNGKCVESECDKYEDDFDNEDVRYEITSFGSSDKLRLYTGEAVEINNEMILKVQSTSGTEVTLKLYDDYGEFRDNDETCSETIEEGNTSNDMCGESTGDIEVDKVDDTDDYVDLYLDDYNAVQFYDEEGVDIDWSGTGCPDDQLVFDKFDSYFYPALDTESSGLDLEGEEFKLLDDKAEIQDIDLDDETISFDLDGEDYDLEDGDTFEYQDTDYQIDLYFNDGGLYRILVEPD